MAGQLTLDHCTLFILELIFFTFYFQYFSKVMIQSYGFISPNFRFYFSKLQVLFLQTSGFISPKLWFYFSKVMVLFLQSSGFISSKLRLYFSEVMVLFVWLNFMLKIVKIQNQIQKLI
jgi:hypothetical protein